MKKKNYTTVHITAAAWFLTCCSLFLISHRRGLLALTALLNVVNLILYYRRRASVRRYLFFLSAAAVILCLAYMLSRNDYIWYLTCILSAFDGAAGLIRLLKERLSVWKLTFTDDKISWLAHLAALLLLTYSTVRLSLLSFQPAGMVRAMNPEAVNTYDFPPAVRETYEEKYTALRNIPYGDEYPNSVFDLLMPEGEKHPVFVWFHGGGFAGGSRGSEDRTREFFITLMREGYAVVSADYALSPDYGYPVPLRQAEQLIRYLTEHQEELNISADTMILGGTGSGAEIALQYLTASFNPAYAEKTGIQPVPKETLKAAYLISACWQPQFSDETNFVLTDFLMYQQSRSYYGSCFLHESANARLADCTPYITSDFPPLLIGEGNTGTYTIQAHRADELLNRLSVPHTAKIFDAAGNNKNLIGISFDTEYNSYAGAVHGEFIRFLREHGLSFKDGQ